MRTRMDRAWEWVRLRPGLSLLIAMVVIFVSYTGYRIGRSHLALRRGEKQYRAAQYAEAAESFNVALEVVPDHAEARFWRGNALGFSGDLDEAVKEFRRAADIEPANARYFGALAHALGMQEKNQEAVSWYRKAVALEPRDAELHVGLATRLLRSGAPEAEAEKALREALRIDPRHGRAAAALRILRTPAERRRAGRSGLP